MIYLNVSKKEDLNLFYEDLFRFFPATVQDLEISTVAFYGIEDRIVEEVLQAIYVDSFCISGLRRQYREKN